MFNAKQFIRDHFQGPGGVIAHCRSVGLQPPSGGQVEKWLERNSVPGEWLAKLLTMLETQHGAPVSLRPYMAATP